MTGAKIRGNMDELEGECILYSGYKTIDKSFISYITKNNIKTQKNNQNMTKSVDKGYKRVYNINIKKLRKRRIAICHTIH